MDSTSKYLLDEYPYITSEEAEAKFLAWETASRDTIDVKRIYVDITGDLIAGVLLSQIVYWYMPDKDGNSKLRIEDEDKLWLAKERADWWEECRITPKQFDRASSVLEDAGLIEKRVKKFQGNTVLHIALNILNLYQRVNLELTKGKFPNLPKVNSRIDERLNPYNTENTTKNTTEIKEEDAILFEPLRITLRHYKGFKETAQLVSKVASKYSHVDLEEEAIKMLSWLEENPKRLCSPAFILNWLGRHTNGSNNYPPATDQPEATYSPGGGHLERTTTKRY